MNIICSKTKWMLITLAITVITTWGAAPYAFAGQPAQTRLYLVSMGVGDVDLITLRAIDTIDKSQVVVCRKKIEDKFATYLKGKEILEKTRGQNFPFEHLVYVGDFRK